MILSASILPFALHLGRGVWTYTGLSEIQCAGRLPFLSSFVDNKDGSHIYGIDGLSF